MDRKALRCIKDLVFVPSKNRDKGELRGHKIPQLIAILYARGFYRFADSQNDWIKYIGKNRRIHIKRVGNVLRFHIDNH